MTTGPDIRWLAGFVDGEGSFTLIRDRTFIKPAFQIANTVVENMRVVKALVSEIVGREVRYMPTKAHPSRVGYRPYYYLYVTRQSELRLLCDALLPHVTGKRQQVELMLRYLAITPQARGEGWSRFQPSRVTEEHFEMVAQMSALNRKYAKGEWPSQRETERLAPELPAEETVRTTE